MKIKLKNYVSSFFLVFLAFTQTSCQKSSPNLNIIVVAVDSLSVNDVSCAQRPVARSGFAALCDDSVRFTHAYTPSILSGPALASLLTGLYPFQHGLHHNGAPGLSSTVQTIAEVAAERSYRTAFLSGGAPIFRKTGLNQGFEIFDDGLVPQTNALHRPFKKNIEAFERWLSQEVGNEPFIAFFHASDLAFLEMATTTPTGEPRSHSFESQFDELDRRLFDLVNILKKRNMWRETLFVFTGLNGRPVLPRKSEISSLNLHTEKTQVPLFIKPQQKVRDGNLNWTIDRNVSLVDVGAMLFDIISDSVPIANGDFPTFSLKSSVQKIDSLPPENRKILIESGMAEWRKWGPLRAGVVIGQDYFIYDRKNKLYNLLTDRFELNPIPLHANEVLFSKEVTKNLKEIGYVPFELNESVKQEKYSIPYLYWVEPNEADTLHKALLQLRTDLPQDKELQQWLEASALAVGDSKLLRQLGRDKSVLRFLFKSPKEIENEKDPCMSLVPSAVVDAFSFKNCSDPVFRDLLSWIKADAKDSSKESLKIRFLKSYQRTLVDRKIARANVGLSLIWDVNPEVAWRATYTDVFLEHPSNQNLKANIIRSLPPEEEEF